jgi:YbgC/YbaW family acyl-CoA thioester hydrolase
MADPFSITRRIQFAETDLAGVLHFSNYFRLMEEVEHAFWRSIGMTVYHGDGQQTVSWPRVAVACEYFAPARFEDELELRFWIVNVGRRSIEFEIEFLRETERIALGRITAVCCDTGHGTFASIEIPAAIRAKLTETKHARPGRERSAKS